MTYALARAVRAALKDRADPVKAPQMIVTGAWWDYVDAIATHQLADVLRNEPRRMKPLLRRWATAEDSIWKRRASILCQNRFKGATDLELLYDCIEPNLTHTDFFMRKAIGWALRQYAWTDPREVNATSERTAAG